MTKSNGVPVVGGMTGSALLGGDKVVVGFTCGYVAVMTTGAVATGIIVVKTCGCPSAGAVAAATLEGGGNVVG